MIARAGRGPLLTVSALTVVLVLAAGCSQQTGSAVVTAVTTTAGAAGSGPGATTSDGAGPVSAVAGPTATSTLTPSGGAEASPAGAAALSLSVLLDTLADVYGPTDGLADQLNRLGWFDPSVPVPPGPLDVLTVAMISDVGLLPTSQRLASTMKVAVRTTASAATIEAFYSAEALGDGWELARSAPSRSGGTLTTYDSTTVEGLTFGWWIDAPASAEGGGTVLNLESNAARPVDSPELARLAGWSPESALAGQGVLTRVEVQSGISALDPAQAAMSITWTFPGADGPTIAGEVSDQVGAEGETSTAGGDDFWLQWDRPPLTGLTGYQLRVSELKDTAALQFDPQLVITGRTTLPN